MHKPLDSWHGMAEPAPRSPKPRRQKAADRVVHGVTAAQCQLLLNTDTRKALAASLRTLGRILGMDRVFVAYHKEGEIDGKPTCYLEIYQDWVSETLMISDRVPLDRRSMSRMYPDWRTRLVQGEAVGDETYQFSEVERLLLFEAGVKSLLILPILQDERCTGCLCLESYHAGFLWTDKDVSVLKGLTIGLGEGMEQPVEEPAADFANGEGREATPLPPAQQALESQILSQVSEAIVALDENFIVIFFNQGAEHLLGLRTDEVIGQPVAHLFRHRSVKVERDAHVLQALEREGHWSGRDTLVLRDWRTRQVTLTLTRPRDGQLQKGAILVLRDILRDVTANRRQELRIEHRLRVESALVEASQQLVSGDEVNFEQLLGLMGEAVGAESVYFVETPPDQHLLQEGELGDSSTSWPRVWEGSMIDESNRPLPIDELSLNLDSDAHRLVCKWNGTKLSKASPKGEQTTLAVPVLSPMGKLHGYLGVEYGGGPPEWQEADARVLAVLADLLSTYFERKISEAAMRESEERYRTYVDTTSEAIWRIEFPKPVSPDTPDYEQVDLICHHGYLAECNQVMANLLGQRNPEKMAGKALSRVMPQLDVALVRAFVNGQYKLNNFEYVFSHGGANRFFVINAVGTVENGLLVRVWGSCVEVTERVRLEQQMVEALEEQQQRIGRDLHDGVGQLLTGIRMLSQNLCEKLEQAEDESTNQAKKVAGFAEQASARVREIYRGLTPTQLFHEGLATALNELAHNTNALPGITCSFVTDGKVDVWEKDTKMHLYRVMQEATNNALKHAGATEILIALNVEEDRVAVRVEDNGCGFDPTIRTGKSLGLNSMAYRARTIKGSFEIKSHPGLGTSVECTFKDNLLKRELTQFVQQ